MIAVYIDWIGRPEVHAAGEKFDVGEMETEVSEIYRRLNLQVASINKEQPAK